jgi:alpha-D-ribose 1-methylphosphonate 5-triphosphate synthase subunit PhnG
MQPDPKTLPNPRALAMGVLAQATLGELQAAVDRLGELPPLRFLRKPEIGMVLVRGRAGGTGAPFNLGEATVTRCSVVVGASDVGHAVLLGRDTERARLAAILDAALQDEGLAPRLDGVIAGILARIEAEDAARARQTAATRVDFFTLVRGEDGQ